MKRPRSALALASLLLTTPAWADAALDEALATYASSYGERFGAIRFTAGEVEGCGPAWFVDDDRFAAPASGPLVLDHGERREHAVVLMHGLSDSPFFVCALARELHEAGANVVLPLLTGHGLVDPLPEAHTPELAERWKADALAALRFAQTRGEHVSAGGLSTGGVLAVWLWTEAPDSLNGGLLLVSAAFDFATNLKLAAGCAGTVAEREHNAFQRWCNARLVGFTQRGEQDIAWRADNPYRIHFSDYGALELGLLRRDTLKRLDTRTFDPPLLVAHSIHDETAPIAGVEALITRHTVPERVELLVVDDVRRANCRELLSDCVTPAPTEAACGVPHASVPLAVPIRRDGSGPVCEPANPLFDDVARAALELLARMP